MQMKMIIINVFDYYMVIHWHNNINNNLYLVNYSAMTEMMFVV